MGLVGGKGGGKNALAAKPNLLNALQVQTSSYGQVIPILYGQNRIAGRLLWSSDFQAIAHTSTQKVGGKGLGSGGSNLSQTSYTYQTAVAIALCMGPIQNLGSVWDTKGALTLLSTSVPFTVPGGGGSFTPTPPSGGVWHSGRGVARTDSFSLNPNDFGSDGSTTLSGNQQMPMALASGSPGAGQYSLNPSTGQHTFSAADAGKMMTITYAYSVPTSNSATGAPASVLNLTLFTGQRPQTPWTYLTSNHPGQDLGYNGIAYVASSAIDLGSSGALPNLSYEVLGLLPFGAGMTDAEPGSIINDLLTNPFYGLGAQTNLILDPGILSAGLSAAYWTQTDISFARGYGAFVFAGTGAASGFHFAYTKIISVTPGQKYTLSGYIDASQVTAGSPTWLIYDPTINTQYFNLGQAPGIAGVVSGVWTCPVGVTQVVIICDTSNCTINGGKLLRFGRPSFSLGTMPNTQLMLDDYTNFSSYCLANGIFLSPVLDAQKPAAQWIQEILDVTNAEAVWSEGLLKLRSYGDTTAVGNGAVFTPATTPIYDLDSNSYLDVVTVKRPSVADIMNSVSIEFVDRANAYNVAVAEDKDEAQIAIHGLRKAQPKTAHSITSATVAAFVANLLRKRQIEVRNAYTVRLGWQYALLEPMDLVNLTIPELGYTKKPVRITAIREDDTGQLELDCEDFPWGTATPTLYAQQTPTRFSPQTNADPGNVNPPIIFEAPVNLSKSGQHEIWMAVSGSSPNWGGAHVWISQDNSEYHQVGTIVGPARMGVLTAGVAAGSDPDTNVFFPVDLTQSNGVLTAGTQTDADSYRTLCFCDGEFIAYKDANLTSSNHYQVGQNSGGAVYVRRGLFGSRNAAHNSGASFARLDDAIFTYVYDPGFVGKTIYLKFTSFNTNGMVEQSVANTSAYQFIVTGIFNPMETVSKNLLANPGFESNQALTPVNTVGTLNLAIVVLGGRVTDNWRVCPQTTGIQQQNSMIFQFAVESVSPYFHSAKNCAVIRLPENVTIPANAALNGIIESDPIPVKPGDAYCWGGFFRWDANAIFPGSGTQVVAVMDIRLGLFASDGSWIGGLDGGNPILNNYGGAKAESALTNAPTNGYMPFSAYGTIPNTVNGRAPAFARVQCFVVVFNQTSFAFNTGNNLYLDCRFDDLFLFPQWTPAGDEIAKIGSISVTYSNSPLSYSLPDPNTIIWSWNFNASRTDTALTINNYAGSQTVSGLTAGTNYYYYPFIDEVNQIVSMVATGGVGSPSWAHTGPGLPFTQEQSRGDHWPLSQQPVQVAQPTSGAGNSGSGGGGIGGPCLRHDALVEEKTRGVIFARELCQGDWVKCPQDEDTPEGWAEVIAVSAHLCQEWVHTFFNCDDWLATTTGHPFTLEDGSLKRAAQLCFEDAIPCLTGATFPVKHEVKHYPARKISVTIRSKRHVFYAGMKAPVILQHNIILES